MMIPQDLRNALQDSSVDGVIAHPPRGVAVKRIAFRDMLVREVDTANYEIMLSDGINAKEEVITLFPNNARQNVLGSNEFRSRARWNKALNDAFAASLDETDEGGSDKFAICYGSYIYVCEAIAGTLYICWASHVHCTTTTDDVPVASSLGSMPVLFNLDGKHVVRSIMLLHGHGKRLAITKDCPTLLYNWLKGGNPFVCEERRETAAPSPLHAISTTLALQRMTYSGGQIAHSIMARQNGLEQSLDDETIHVDPNDDDDDDDDDNPDSGVTIDSNGEPVEKPVKQSQLRIPGLKLLPIRSPSSRGSGHSDSGMESVNH